MKCLLKRALSVAVAFALALPLVAALTPVKAEAISAGDIVYYNGGGYYSQSNGGTGPHTVKSAGWYEDVIAGAPGVAAHGKGGRGNGIGKARGA